MPVLGQVKLQALTPVQLNHLYAHLLERSRRKTTSRGWAGLAPKTVRNVHVLLHSALHDTMRWGYLVRNVAEAADPPSGADRRLALDPVTLEALRAHRQRQAEDHAAVGRRYRNLGYVFTWPDGRPLHPDNIADWFEQHTRAASLPRIRLHDVRHSYATAALKAGISARVISERLGHASVAFTLQTYGHVIPGMDKDAAATVADLILGGTQKGPGTLCPGPLREQGRQ